jgi:hypothetical protein
MLVLAAVIGEKRFLTGMLCQKVTSIASCELHVYVWDITPIIWKSSNPNVEECIAAKFHQV